VMKAALMKVVDMMVLNVSHVPLDALNSCLVMEIVTKLAIMKIVTLMIKRVYALLIVMLG